jgi:isocitrate dehydrogenase
VFFSVGNLFFPLLSKESELMTTYMKIKIPEKGEIIKLDGDGRLLPCSFPIIPFIEGDGIGPDIWRASRLILDEAVKKTYGGKKKIQWMEIYGGEKALGVYGKNQWLPQETLKVIREFRVALKGPLTTPVGGGIRSINVALRQQLDLYACVRPVRWFKGVPAPVKEPHKLDVIIFRENTEDVYSGIEFRANSRDARDVIRFLKTKVDKKSLRLSSAVGVKPVSAIGSQRLISRAIQYAISHGLPSVTMVHKGNIMKFTEGAFRSWGYDLARKKFPNQVITEEELYNRYKGKAPKGRVVLKDRIADAMFQQLLLRPSEYSVIATLNLNGDYISDACAAQVGGLGLAPGANIGDRAALFEATHGTAPKYAGLDKVNPGSLLLSGTMLLEHLGWDKAAKSRIKAVSKTISQKKVTYDLARQMSGAREVKCSEFAKLVVKNL